MSIANALNNALSGLTATARGTEVIASNLANALTPGYARRELDLSPRIIAGNGGGVQVGNVNRIVSASVLSDFRIANAEVARSTVIHDFYKSLEAKIGLPSDGGSLSAMLSDFDASLISAASRPDSEVRLRAVFETADQLAKKIRAVSASIQDSRTEADQQIGLKISSLNNDLSEVARLNRQIIVEQANGRDASSLADARQVVIDRISMTIPVREVPRDNGRIALFSSRGAVLLDGSDPTRFDFNLSGRMTPEVDGSSPQLGSLTLDGVRATPAQMDLISGGSLSELFKLRDEYGVAAQASIDAIARELHDRFASPTIDPSITPGRSGMFADESGSFDPARERGLAARLIVSPMVDEKRGGDIWRIRDGIYATAEGNAGYSDIITELSKSMNSIRPYASAEASTSSGDISSLFASVLSDVSSQRLTAEVSKSHGAAMQSSLQEALYAEGVDSDREMELLLQLEKTYAANAKVIVAVEEMLDSILRI